LPVPLALPRVRLALQAPVLRLEPMRLAVAREDLLRQLALLVLPRLRHHRDQPVQGLRFLRALLVEPGHCRSGLQRLARYLPWSSSVAGIADAPLSQAAARVMSLTGKRNLSVSGA
jgi:hypothetical protein